MTKDWEICISEDKILMLDNKLNIIINKLKNKKKKNGIKWNKFPNLYSFLLGLSTGIFLTKILIKFL